MSIGFFPFDIGLTMSDILLMKNDKKRDIFIKSLEAKKKASGHTDASLAKAAGLNPTAVRDIIQKSKNMPRYDTLTALAKELNCSVNDLVTFGNVEFTDYARIKVKGFVQAGQFGGADELYSSEEEIMYVSPKYKNAHCLIVRGDSMDVRYKHGTKLICVPFFGTPEEVEPGRAVIVEAISTADEKEITVKEFYTDNQGTHWLVPRSSNPTYQNYPVPNGQDLDIIINGNKIKEINITALVVSSQYDEE